VRSSLQRIFLTANFCSKRTYSNTYRKDSAEKYVDRPQAREERGLLVVKNHGSRLANIIVQHCEEKKILGSDLTLEK
jgi:hypothetical protein